MISKTPSNSCCVILWSQKPTAHLDLKRTSRSLKTHTHTNTHSPSCWMGYVPASFSRWWTFALGESRENRVCRISTLRSRAVHSIDLGVSYLGHFPVGVKPKGESHKGLSRSCRLFHLYLVVLWCVNWLLQRTWAFGKTKVQGQLNTPKI